MFGEAYIRVRCFTFPLIYPYRLFNGDVKSGGGVFIVLNEEGWVMTAYHHWQYYRLYEKHKKELYEYRTAIESIRQNSKISSKKKETEIDQLPSNPNWITNIEYRWGLPGQTLKDIQILEEGDLMIGRLEPFKLRVIGNYPVIKNPKSELYPGTSLCKVGIPLAESVMDISFDGKNKTFIYGENMYPIPLFPLEGVYTRTLIADATEDGKYKIKFLETSSPGLSGHSGGPCFDKNGVVWAIHLGTDYHLLEKTCETKHNDKIVNEQQVFATGRGVHPELIIAFLQDHKVNFHLSETKQ